ncbi:MAG: tetratricopeptide repeat protein [Holophagales bacterium]|nr:tetratricopeptide repeat protein [Holophagales bacterium]
MSEPLKGFIAYSHKDTQKKDELRMRLAVMKQQNKLVTWHDGDITGGGKARQEYILKEVAASDILLYLVSAASLDSENCNKELAEALSAEIRIIPIILESCDWLNHQLSDFQALPDKGKPINEWNPESRGWQDVVDSIRKVVEEMQVQANPLSNVSKEEILSDSVFQQGNILVVLKQINKAIERYSHAIELNPNHTHAYNNRGIAYENTDDFDRAIEDFDTAIRLNPNYAIAYNNRGAAYHDKGDIDCAIEDLNMAIKLNRSYAEAYYNRGNIYNNKGNSDHAIADYTKAIGFNPNYTHAYNNRGNVYYDKGDYDRAIEDLNMAIKLNRSYANGYTNRGNAYEKKGDYDRAIADHTKAIDLDSNNAYAYFNRGNVYDKKGDYDRAIVDYTKAIDLNPKHAHAYGGRGVVYGKKGEYDLAIKDLSTAIEFKSDDAVGSIFCYNRGYAYEKKGDYTHAIVDYTKAIQLKQDYADAYYNRGVSYYRKGKIRLAIEDYNRTIQLKPDFVTITYYNRGEAWLHLEEWDKAREDLTNARDLGVDIVASFRNDYKNIEAYERANRVKLPEDIANMLTQRRRSRVPKKEKLLY